MNGNRHSKQGSNDSPGGSGKVPKPPHDITVKISQPFTIRQEPTAEDNKQYTEEKESRSAQVRAAQRLNKISILASVIAFASLFFLYMQIRQSRRVFETGQRAWITVTRTPILPVGPASVQEIPIAAGIQLNIPIIFKNGGQSPALHVRMKKDPNMFVGNGCDGRTVPSPYISEMPVGPGQESANASTAMIVSQECVDALQRGQATFTLSGVISYDDIFGHERHTYFCYQYEGARTHQMSACPKGNELD